MKLTQKLIDALECEEGQKDALFFNSAQRGLGVRVTAAGGKNFLVQYSFGGQKRRMPLGSCDAISLADARLAAQSIMGEVARGNDPFAAKREADAAAKAKAARDALTLEVLIAEWSKLQLASKSERYRAEAVRALKVDFKDFLAAPAADITREMIVNAVDTMTEERGAMMTARTVAYGKAAFTWAQKLRV